MQTDVRPSPALTKDQMASPTTPEVSAQEARTMLHRGEVHLLDVREMSEWMTTRIPQATLIPMAEIPQRLHEIPRDRTLIVLCRTGRRSATVTETLRQAGYERVYNMAGGIEEWMNQQYPVEASGDS